MVLWQKSINFSGRRELIQWQKRISVAEELISVAEEVRDVVTILKGVGFIKNAKKQVYRNIIS